MTNSDDGSCDQFETSVRTKLFKCKLLVKIGNAFSRITVEPLLVVSLFTIVMYSIISQQYIYQQTAKKYGLIDNATKSASCSAGNISDATKELQAKVSAETSTWVLYLNIAGTIFDKWLCGITGGLTKLLAFFFFIQLKYFCNSIRTP